jgi:hypothetical protein
VPGLLASSESERQVCVLTLVYLLPTRIDCDNVGEFQDDMFTLIERHGALILDCSQVEFITVQGMRVIEWAAKSGTVTLVRATPIVHLLASVFSLDVDNERASVRPVLSSLPDLR